MSDGLVHHHHEPTNYGMVSAPHGPETGDDHATLPKTFTEEDERRAVKASLYPDDSFTPEGEYWADLPFGQRLSFVTGVDNAEAKKELGQIGAMMKKDPLSPVAWYFRNAVLPGAGLGLEGYVLFSIGNLTSLFDIVWKDCWKSGKTCNSQWVAAVAYLEIVGIMVGQVLVGYLGDKVGRRFGLIQDAVIMFLGLLMLTASWGVTLNGWVICYAISLLFYGIGVGGEYPMTATAAMENATGSGKISTKEDRLHRGRKVTMAFLMQGWGQFFNQVVLILLLLIFHHGSGNAPYSELSVQWTFRVSFAIPAVGTLWLVYYRWYKMPLASKQLDMEKRRTNVTGYDINSLKMGLKVFPTRILATAGTWFCNDVFFYGNKLFQSAFIGIIAPKASEHGVMTGWLWNLCNIGVSLAGYYLASFLIDHKFYGRKMMMQVGFLMDFILFIIPAFHFHYYESNVGVHAFQAMYFLSSFFNQFGPNSVTFLVAAEVYPTPIRASAHGFSAAIGKAGALLAAVLYSYITDQTKFYFVPWFGLAGMLLTALFLPDTTGLDLKEQERRWSYIMQGRGNEYHGVAIHPTHLSLWERLRGVGKNYNPKLDYEDRMRDFAAEWESNQEEKSNTEEGVAVDSEDYAPEINSYFSRNGASSLKQRNITSEEITSEKYSNPDSL
jgi:MFS family permease